jgi:limonene-1,2-epoxide hydrolase
LPTQALAESMNARQAPQELTRAFAAALSAAELDCATSFFTADGSFVTPDATAVSGLRSIRAILFQLIASRVQLQVEPRSIRMSGGMVICNERWIFTYARDDAAPFILASDSAILLCRPSNTWRLLIAAPWGIADADRNPFAALPWPR